MFDAADGAFMLTTVGDKMYRRLCEEVLKQPDLVGDARFKSARDRVENKDALRTILSGLFQTKSRDHWLERLHQVGIPAGIVRSVGEAMEAPETAEQGAVVMVEHPTAGPLKHLRPLMRLSGTPTAKPYPAPSLGQHTRDVLRDLAGYEDVAIDRLIDAGTAAAEE